jgi:adenosylmethionine-8-amino-7-oxononanoate aminotransferase
LAGAGAGVGGVPLPYCTTREQLRRMVSALAESVAEVF